MADNKILIISPHDITERMAGPGIRYWEFASFLGRIASVQLAAPNDHDLPQSKSFEIVTYHRKKLPKLVESCDVVLIQGYLLAEYPFLQDISQCLVVDLYDPYPLEELTSLPASQLGEELYRSSLATMLLQIFRGDFFICASERQRDFYLGILTALGRVNPETYRSDVTFRKLIDVVPFGLPSEAPVKSQEVLKGVIPNIEKTDKVILWGGGIYDWLDPLTPIYAMNEISKMRNDIKLFFMGLAHPQQGKVGTKMASQAVDLAKKMNLTDRFVFFNTGWVPYEQRQNYLLEADVGISTHPEHLEARFSYRTRILDYIWAGLPIVASNGDSLSDLIRQNRLGITIEPGDPKGVSEAILSILSVSDYREVYRQRSASVASTLRWQKAVQPLINYCKHPERAVDHDFMAKNIALRRSLARTLMKTKSIVRTSWLSLREERLDVFMARAQAYLKRRANK